ncbi:hypothetical protein [Rhodococcus phage REQ1]|uniref:hypothetical protein n=1 Tax=Rhodococcus phage REQ1 TaxID=1109712 RepID=UPI00023EEBFD|nr:hypothetical protein RoPhREQ1_gp28 [Rhodococcus phage REQ1]AEV52024.1 hypothetical protein [Rhodococcus phage REQ1]
MSTDETGRILREAADLIETKGWARFLFASTHGEHCALGAIREAADGSIFETDKSRAATARLAQTLRDRGVEGDPERDYSWLGDSAYREESENFDLVTDWNDADDRTAAEVIQALREAGHG